MPEVENFHRSKDRVTACLVHLRGLPETSVITEASASSRALFSSILDRRRRSSAVGKSSRPSMLRQTLSAAQEPSRAAVIFQLTPSQHRLTKPKKSRGAADSPARERRTR